MMRHPRPSHDPCTPTDVRRLLADVVSHPQPTPPYGVARVGIVLDSRAIHRCKGRLVVVLRGLCAEAVERVAAATLGVEGTEWQWRDEDGRFAAARERALHRAAQDCPLNLKHGGIAPARRTAAAARQRCMADGAARLAFAAAEHAFLRAAQHGRELQHSIAAAAARHDDFLGAAAHFCRLLSSCCRLLRVLSCEVQHALCHSK